MRCSCCRGAVAGEESFLQQISGINCAWQNYALRPTPQTFVPTQSRCFLNFAVPPQLGEIVIAQIADTDCTELDRSAHARQEATESANPARRILGFGSTVAFKQPIADAEQIVAFGKPIEPWVIR